MMTSHLFSRFRCFSILFALTASAASADAAAIFGTLSNFDVVNDTTVGGVGQVCHGFEIELDGVLPSEISYTFGAPYNRYGDPSLIDNGAGGTIVRYAAGFSGGAWSAVTPFATTAITTGGHQFWTGGDPLYPAGVPGDHFGMALNGNPTNTAYRWLLGDSAGNLTPAGTTLKFPAPVWTVAPAANPAAPAAVQVVVAAPPKQNPAKLFGDAIWAKVFVTESTAPAELDHLLVGDPATPGYAPDLSQEPAEVEVEWQLLQVGKGAGFDELDSGLNDLAKDSESITRRFEFYKYTGSFDVDGEALDENPLDPSTPNIVGEFIGGQNAALNLAAFGIPEPATLALLGIGFAALLRSRRRA